MGAEVLRSLAWLYEIPVCSAHLCALIAARKIGALWHSKGALGVNGCRVGIAESPSAISNSLLGRTFSVVFWPDLTFCIVFLGCF